MSRAVLLLGRPTNPHIAALRDELSNVGAEARVLDPRLFPRRSTISVSLSPGGRPRAESSLVDLDGVVSGWFSSQDGVRVSSAVERSARAFARAAAVAGLVCLRVNAPFRWHNDPNASRTSSDKLLQLVHAQRAGFRVPETLVTNDPARFAAFVRRRKRVAVKSPSGSDGLPDSMRVLTQLVTPEDLSDVGSVALAPVMAQAYVAKRTEVRATVVGDKVFAAEIHSQETERTKIDWRRYDHRTRYDALRLPRAVERACVRTARACGLAYSGIDLIRTPKDEYVFLEANSEPAWLWCEDLTGQPITRAMATMLLRART